MAQEKENKILTDDKKIKIIDYFFLLLLVVCESSLLVPVFVCAFYINILCIYKILWGNLGGFYSMCRNITCVFSRW